MLCLSLWNPWAVLLVSGHKRVETRGWPLSHRGPLLIHAAKKWSAELADLCETEPFVSRLVASVATSDSWRASQLPFGAVVGRVDVVGCYRTEDVDFDHAGLDVGPHNPVWQYAPGKLRLWPDPERAFGDYGPRRFAFLCANPVGFETPVPFRGHQGLFTVPDDLLPEETRPCPLT